jgi:hypothetical protein
MPFQVVRSLPPFSRVLVVIDFTIDYAHALSEMLLVASGKLGMAPQLK